MRKSLLFCVLLAGCGSPILPVKGDDSGMSDDEEDGWSSGTTPPGGGSDDGGATGGGATGGGATGGDDPAPLENPSLSYVSAACLEGTVAFWQLVLVATDPQGIDTLSRATCEIYPVGVTEGDPRHTLTLECDGAGSCRQNYDGEDEGVLCSEASNWDFHFTIMDDDGYLSTVEVVTGVAE